MTSMTLFEKISLFASVFALLLSLAAFYNQYVNVEPGLLLSISGFNQNEEDNYDFDLVFTNNGDETLAVTSLNAMINKEPDRNAYHIVEGNFESFVINTSDVVIKKLTLSFKSNHLAKLKNKKCLPQYLFFKTRVVGSDGGVSEPINHIATFNKGGIKLFHDYIDLFSEEDLTINNDGGWTTKGFNIDPLIFKSDQCI